ncbi:cytochrome P450 [Streptomyces sp. NPDC087300]|uniref:cytochrome P450 n=1 Tax=Streptomyces sp. NPDC087300 TaxID=3365780 RepID=UPI00380C6CC6
MKPRKEPPTTTGHNGADRTDGADPTDGVDLPGRAEPEAPVPDFPLDRAPDRPLDPPPAYARLRAERPLSRVRLWNGDDVWLVVRYEDQRAILSDTRFSADPTLPGYPQQSAAVAMVSRMQRDARPFATLDGEEHAFHRRMLVPEFTARRMRALRPAIEAFVEQLLDAMAAKGPEADLVEAYALPLPSLTICQLLGVPYQDHALFQRLAEVLVSRLSSKEQAMAAGQELNSYLDWLIGFKGERPGDDIVSRLVAEQLRDGRISRARLISTARLLLHAGHETTAHQIALGTLELLRNPDQLAQLRDTADPALVESAVDELLRRLSITHAGRRRVALADVSVAGRLIRAGEGVVLPPESANHDAAVFDGPDRLDLRRPARPPHLAFGHGPHQCIGRTLARLELQVAHPALLRRFPRLRLATAFEELPFRHDMLIYGVHALPVTW